MGAAWSRWHTKALWCEFYATLVTYYWVSSGTPWVGSRWIIKRVFIEHPQQVFRMKPFNWKCFMNPTWFKVASLFLRVWVSFWKKILKKKQSEKRNIPLIFRWTVLGYFITPCLAYLVYTWKCVSGQVHCPASRKWLKVNETLDWFWVYLLKPLLHWHIQPGAEVAHVCAEQFTELQITDYSLQIRHRGAPQECRPGVISSAAGPVRVEMAWE